MSSTSNSWEPGVYYSGFIMLDSRRVQVDFVVSPDDDESQAHRDAAFVAALAQMVRLKYIFQDDGSVVGVLDCGDTSYCVNFKTSEPIYLCSHIERDSSFLKSLGEVCEMNYLEIGRVDPTESCAQVECV